MSIIKRGKKYIITHYHNKQKEKEECNFRENYVKNYPFAENEWRKNEQYHDAFKGKRCFVLGNGPSLKDINLSILKDEYTFTVNQIARRKDFGKLHTNFHFWADPLFFDLDINKPEDKELLEVMKSVDTEDNHPVIFFPMEYVQFTHEYGLRETLTCGFYSAKDINGDIKDIDFSSFVPGFHTVVQYCIAMAIYMGFSEIYLLGCENTGIISNIHASLNEHTQEYGYDISKNEQKRLIRVHEKVTMTQCAYSFYRTLLDYDRLCQFCDSHSIKIRNCTPSSVIESIQKDKFENIFI